MVLRAHRQPHGPHHAGGRFTEFDDPDAEQPAARDRAGRDGNIWFGVFAGGKIGRITPQGVITEFALPTPDSGPRALAAGPDGNIWVLRVPRQQDRAHHAARRDHRVRAAAPEQRPGDITAGADGAMWFLELSGTMDGLQPDGDRVGRITMDGRSPNIRCRARHRLADQHRGRSGPQGLVHARQHDRPRDPDGRVDEFPLGEGARAVGMTAGSDRQPPQRLTDRLWFADGSGGRLCYLQFQ